MGLRRWVRKTSKKAEHAVVEAAEAVEHTAQDTGRAIEGTGKDALEQTQGFFDKQIKELGMSAIDDVKKDIRNFAESTVKTVKSEAVDEISKLAESAKESIREEAKQVEDGLTKKLPALVQQVLAELEKAVSKEGLKIIRRSVSAAHDEMGKLREWDATLAGYIDAQSFEFEIGPLTLSYGAFYLRAEELVDALDRYINQPPAFRRTELLELIAAMGPDTVDTGFKVQAALLVVSSSSVGVGYKMPKMPLKLFTHLGDKALAALGVPE